MTDYIFMGDYHARKRFPFTTQMTQQRFEAMKANIWLDVVCGSGEIIGLGDLFDTFETSATTLIEGYTVASKCLMTLAGNHDLSLNVDKVSALQHLKQSLGVPVALHHARKIVDGDLAIHFVPHCLTQEQFEEELETVYDDAESNGKETNILCLHTNYGEPQGKVIENYFSPATARAFSTVFKHIISGHEHDFAQRSPSYTSLGSIVPFSFGELQDKFIGIYDEVMGLVYQRVWSNERCWKGSAQDFLASTALEELQFIEITGGMSVAEAVEIGKISAKLYRESPHLIAIKNGAQINKSGADAGKIEKPQDWVDKIRGRLKGSELDIFEEVYKNVH